MNLLRMSYFDSYKSLILHVSDFTVVCATSKDFRIGLGDVYQIGIGRCLQWNIVMEDDIGGRG